MLIRNYQQGDQITVSSLKVSKDQSDFIDPITLSLTNMDRDSYVMETSGHIIGFFQIDARQNQLELHEVFIDHRHQGKGHGKEFMSSLAPFLRKNYPRANAVFLTVNCRNSHAKRLYEFGDFIDTGDLKKDGPAGPQHIMKKSLLSIN
ncbi:GNAT family N-acetyltransferase [Kiloniella litopenaei]|uniref:GNAT family N-acetyltransferase n=1 Tax=Kiloniella litopenaei TaxID=1549748 RepID=UPI003BA8855B